MKKVYLIGTKNYNYNTLYYEQLILLHIVKQKKNAWLLLCNVCSLPKKKKKILNPFKPCIPNVILTIFFYDIHVI